MNCETDCSCRKDPFECECSGGINPTIITKTEDTLAIECSEQLQELNICELPNITISDVNELFLESCPLPQQNFHEILERFSINSITSLAFSHSEMGNIVLTANYFHSLGELTTLYLNNNGIIELEEDVFVNTQNLTNLSLQNNNMKLKRNMFRHIPLLTFLDVSDCNLKSLPDNIFQPLNKLQVLDLSGNQLTTLKEFTFAGLFNLHNLVLSINKIEKISINAFKMLKNLRNLKLFGNSLTTIPSNLFAHNKRLKSVVMDQSGTLNLSDYLFSNLSLSKIFLVQCNIRTIPQHIFRNTTTLNIIKLDRNRLKNLPESLFEGLVNLHEINLQRNRLRNIPNLAGLEQLTSLFLQNNLITHVNGKVFVGLNNLTKLNLRGNRIKEIYNENSFRGAPNLQIINLSQNSLRRFNLMKDIPNIRSIDLSQNNITQVENMFDLETTKNLQFLNLTYNKITNITVRFSILFTKNQMIKFQFNNLHTVTKPFEDHNTGTVNFVRTVSCGNAKIFLKHNPIQCDCNIYNLVKYFSYELESFPFEEKLKCRGPPKLKNKLIKDLSPSLLTCSLEEIAARYTGCPQKCLCSWRPLDTSVVVDCSNKNFSVFPEILLTGLDGVRFNQTEIHLENNSLITGPDWSLKGYDNVTSLFLSHNKITSLSWLPPKLEVLRLDHNRISKLNDKLINYLNNLVDLTLDNNPWLCECNTEPLVRFLRQHAGHVDITNVLCDNTTTSLVNFDTKAVCPVTRTPHIIALTLSILLMCSISLALYYRYKQRIKIWLFAKNLCLWWVTEEALDKDKTFDVFISYSHKDENFVVRSLLPVLERGPRPYKVCLHHRNWQPGEFITTHITNSVLASRRTLVVLSQNYLTSVWGKMEFRTAHTQAMSDGRARVIIVLYGELDEDGLDPELKNYLRTNTYVKWGDPYFWNKLKYALPHRREIDDKGKRNTTDERETLVESNPSSPGSSPPISSALVKEDPLKFVKGTPDSEKLILSHIQ
jgi:protein toll